MRQTLTIPCGSRPGNEPSTSNSLSRRTSQAHASRLTDDVLRRLHLTRPDLKESIEVLGTWDGPADVLVEDRFDEGTSRTLVRLREEGAEAQVYFAGREPVLECGQHVRVERMRIDDIVAATAAIAVLEGGAETLRKLDRDP